MQFILGKFDENANALSYPSEASYLKDWLQKQIDKYGTEDDVDDDHVQGALNKAYMDESAYDYTCYYAAGISGKCVSLYPIHV